MPYHDAPSLDKRSEGSCRDIHADDPQGISVYGGTRTDSGDTAITMPAGFRTDDSRSNEGL